LGAGLLHLLRPAQVDLNQRLAPRAFARLLPFHRADLSARHLELVRFALDVLAAGVLDAHVDEYWGAADSTGDFQAKSLSK
jgi:hypothetical protein